MAAPSGPFATQYVQGVYIPSALLLFGVFIVKKEWLPYAVAVAAVLGSYKVWVNRKTILNGLSIRRGA